MKAQLPVVAKYFFLPVCDSQIGRKNKTMCWHGPGLWLALSTFLCVFDLSICLSRTHQNDLSVMVPHENQIHSYAQPEICRGQPSFEPSQTPQDRKVGSKFDTLRNNLIQITVRSHEPEPQLVTQDLIKAKLSELEHGFVRWTTFAKPVSAVHEKPGNSIAHLEGDGSAANLINSRLAHTSLLLRWILRFLNPKLRSSARSNGKAKDRKTKLDFQAKLAKLQNKLNRSRAKTVSGKLSDKMDDAIYCSYLISHQ